MSCRMLKNGKCRRGLFGGSPTESDCASCEWYEGPMRGAGDLVAKAAKVTGINKAVQKITKGDCGCGKRRAKLNDAIPFGGNDAEPNHDHEK